MWILLIASVCHAQFAPSIIKKKKQSVFAFNYILKDMSMTQATGFFIDSNTFVTNFHVIDTLEISFPFTTLIGAETNFRQFMELGPNEITEVKQLSALYDLALLKTSKPVPKKFILKPGKLTENKVYILSYLPIVLPKIHLFEGKVIQKYSNDVEIMFEINTSKKSLGGMSGSPILNEFGEVIGVVTRAFAKGGVLKGVLIKHALQLQKSTDLPNIPVQDLIRQEMQKLQDLAESGDLSAQIALGIRLLNGQKLNKSDQNKALKWFKVAAANPTFSNFFTSSFHLQVATLEYKFFMQDAYLNQEEINKLQASAESGKLSSQLLLAFLFLDKARNHSTDEALKWFSKAAMKHPAVAMYAVEYFLYKMNTAQEQQTISTQEDTFKDSLIQKQFKSWLLRAGEEGEISAQFILGISYQNGSNGFQKNQKEALKWLFRAARQGHAKSYKILKKMVKQKNSPRESHQAKFYLRNLQTEENDLCQNTF